MTKIYDRKIYLSSISITCKNPFHNSGTPAINAKVFNFTCSEDPYQFEECYQNLTIIPQGTIVTKQAWQYTLCDGNIECFDNVDEVYCGFDTFYTLFIGNFKYIYFLQKHIIGTNVPLFSSQYPFVLSLFILQKFL